MKPTTPEFILLSLGEAGYNVRLDPAWLTPQIKLLMQRYINHRYWSKPKNWLVVDRVPYVRMRNRSFEISKTGKLVLPIDLLPSGEVMENPFHWSFWRGGFPHRAPCDNGEALVHIEVPEPRNKDLRQKLKSRQLHGFSVKPRGSGHYPSYLAKVRKYVSFVTPKAQKMDPSVSTTSSHM